MKKLGSKFFIVLFLNIIFSKLSLGHNLEMLIDSCDLVSFKKVYQDSDLSLNQKEELLNQVNGIIETDLKKLKSFFGGLPPAKFSKIVQKGYPILAYACGVFCVLGSGFGISGLVEVSFGKEKIRNRPGLVAANYSPTNWVQLKNALDNWDKAYTNLSYSSGALAAISILGMAYMVFFYKYMKSNLGTYKKYKKALKIKQLIQQSIPNISVESIKIEMN